MFTFPSDSAYQRGEFLELFLCGSKVDKYIYRQLELFYLDLKYITKKTSR